MKFASMLLGLCALLVLSACNSQAEAEQAGGGMPPAQVEILSVKPQDAAVNFEYVGQVSGSNEVEVHARVSGIIEKRLYEEGRAVSAGQTLFKLDSKPFKVQLEQAQAALAMAKAERVRAQAQLTQAEREYARIAPLASKKMLSQSELDSAAAAVDVAKASVLQTKAAIQQAQAGINAAQIDLDYTVIKAPITGTVGRATKREGSLIKAGGDSLLTTVAQTDPAYVNFGMADNEFHSIRQSLAAGGLLLPDGGFEVGLKTSSGELLPQRGTLNFQDYKVDPQTGNVAMRATVANSKRELLPGQFIHVVLQGGKRPQAMVVPQRAVLDNPQGKFVYVLVQNEQGMDVALPRPVTVGEWVKLDGMQNGWIIQSGLEQGDKVIVEGMARIFFPGMPVQLASPKAAVDEQAKAASAADQAEAEPSKAPEPDAAPVKE